MIYVNLPGVDLIWSILPLGRVNAGREIKSASRARDWIYQASSPRRTGVFTFLDPISYCAKVNLNTSATHSPFRNWRLRFWNKKFFKQKPCPKLVGFSKETRSTVCKRYTSEDQKIHYTEKEKQKLNGEQESTQKKEKEKDSEDKQATHSKKGRRRRKVKEKKKKTRKRGCPNRLLIYTSRLCRRKRAWWLW